MQKELLEQLKRITVEEQAILMGNHSVEKGIYTAGICY